MAVLATPNTSSEVVLEAQKLINKSALQSRAPESGAFDKSTIAALKQFQIESGARPTGVLDDKTMDLLRKAATAKAPDLQIVLNGKIYLLTIAEHKALMTRVKQEFRPALTTLRSAVAEARGYYDHMKELNKQQYIVAWCIEAYNRKSLPAESLIKSAENGVAAAEKALESGNFKSFPPIFTKAEANANKARAEMKKYVASMIDGGGDIELGLQIVSTTSFIVVGILAAPVAASYGAGAIGSAVIAGAGTSAVETLANEAGKGIAGSSKGFQDAGVNVLRDAFIGGSIGALVKGKGGEALFKKIAPKAVKLLSGKLFEKASEKVVVKWLILYLQKNGAEILEGIMKETLKSFKSNSESLTVEKFCGIVAKELATAGIFSKFGATGDVSALAVLKQVGMKQRLEWLEELGDKASPGDVEKLFGKAFEESYKEWGGRVYDYVLGKLTGAETPSAVEKKIIDEISINKSLMKAMDQAVMTKSKKKK